MLMQVAEKTAGLRAVELKRVPMSLEGSAFRSKFLDVDELLNYCSWFAVRTHFLLYTLLAKMNLVKFSFLLLLFVKSFSWVDLVFLTSITMLCLDIWLCSEMSIHLMEHFLISHSAFMKCCALFC